MGRKSVIVQKIGIVCNEDPLFSPCCGKHVFITSATESEIRSKLGIVAITLQNLGDSDARILVDKESRLSPIFQV